MIKTLLINIMLLIILTGCAKTFQPSSEKTEQIQAIENMAQYSGTSDNTAENTPTALCDEDFIAKSEKTFIELESKYETLNTNEKITNVSYLDENHVYDTYVYENYIVSVSPVNSIIFFINLTTPELKTSRGISVGDSISDVFEKYGLVDGNSYMYIYDGKILTFYVDEVGKVTNIVFEIV